MPGSAFVTCFVRSRGEIYLHRRTGEADALAGQWDAITGPLDGDPDRTAQHLLDLEDGRDGGLVRRRRGDPVTITAGPADADRTVHPFLFDVQDRDALTASDGREGEWVAPPAIRDRETVPWLRAAYDRVRPTVETIRTDRERGSAALSITALSVLRDAAAFDHGDGNGAWAALTDLARDLRDARPAMTVIGNRVNRVMARAATDRTATAVERAARTAIAAARAADEAAAGTAAAALDGDVVVTLSRSGTVAAALSRAAPSQVFVAESRPGAEGVGVAERLAADGVDVTLVPDAAVAQVLADEPVDAALVGADRILPDGSVVNKVGTRALALAAAREAIPCLVAAAIDKVSPERTPDREQVDPETVYDGDAPIAVAAPRFDVTPADLVTEIATEDGHRDPGEIAAIAADHRASADWDE